MERVDAILGKMVVDKATGYSGRATGCWISRRNTIRILIDAIDDFGKTKEIWVAISNIVVIDE